MDKTRKSGLLTRRKSLQLGAAGALALGGFPYILKGAKAQPMAGKTLGYSLSFSTIEWVVQQRRGVEETARALGFDVIVADGQDNPAKQVRDLEDLMIRRCDAILISTWYAEAITPAVRQINQRGIPIVVLSSSLAGDVDWTCHLSTDTLGTARSAGEYYAERLGGSGKVVQIEGKPGSVVNQMRGAGWRESLAKHPGIEIVSHVIGEYERVLALRVMEDVLQAQREIDAVYCHNDEMALGAYQAAREVGRQDEMWFTGYDAVTLDALEAIYNGQMHASWQYMPFGAEAVAIAARILDGHEVPKQIEFPSPLVTRDNVEEWYDPATRQMKPFEPRLDLIGL